MKPVEITEKTFEEFVSSNDTVVMDLWAPWCGPCKMLSPVLDELGEEHEEIVIGKVNVDDNMEIARKYSVNVIPALLLFKNGQLKDKSVGYLEKNEILDFINKN